MSYRTRDVMIYPKDELYSWCEIITSNSNNLKNAARFRQRQLLTASKKEWDECFESEKEIINEFIKAGIFDSVDSRKAYCNDLSLEKAMKATKNPDYYAKGLPRQSAQQILKQAHSDMKSFFEAMKDYKEHPEKYKAKPELPGYNRKGGHCSAVVTNQDCTLTQKDDGKIYAGLPFAKKYPLCIGKPDGVLKQVIVTPIHGIYKISFVFENMKGRKPLSQKEERIAGVDLGVDNLMAVTNNCGLPCLLYKGGIVKSINHFYNKKLADIMSKETLKPDCPKGKDGLPKFYPTSESQALTRHRNNQLKDQMHKSAKHLIAWCVENRIDTLVIGVNNDWKQSVNIGVTNNQNFVQIPHAVLRSILKYLCEEEGIRYIEQEESYTSKASFLDDDYIPVYGVDDEKAVFSGKRRPTTYKGMHKASGFRGLYRAGDGTTINSDLNGSANILRKAYSNAFKFGKMPSFDNVWIIKNSDQEFILYNKKEQKKNETFVLSRSKAKRLKKKLCA